MAPGRPNNPTIAAIEDAAGAASAMLEAMTIVMVRHRITLTKADWDEYEAAIDARDRLLGYLAIVRKKAVEDGKY